MKKLFLMLAVAMLTVSASAQKTAVTANKAGDNWYIGINAGVATPMNKFRSNLGGGEDFGFMKGVSPEFGVRVGKNLTTVFGLALDINNYFGNKSDSKSMFGSKTFINSTDFDILSTWNLSNLFGGYQGVGLNYKFGTSNGTHNYKIAELRDQAEIDALNLGAAKQWQVYLEPGVVFGQPAPMYANPFRKVEVLFNGKKWNGAFSLKLGVNYKFGTSNGTHNFKIEELRDQAEIDALNAKINELRGDVDAKNGQLNAANQTINDLKKKLAECEARPTQIVEEKKETTLQPIVIFRQGKSTIDAAQYASVEMVAKYLKNHPESKVLVKGYASPEGKAELNQKLSEARATAVANALIKRYKISKDRITTQGLGATSEISEENDFNRVAMFVDTTK